MRKIEPIDGWKEAAKVTRLLGALMLVMVVAGLVFPTPWSVKIVTPDVSGPARPVESDSDGAAKTDPATGKVGKVEPADKIANEGASKKAEPSAGDLAMAAAEPAPKHAAHGEPRAKEVSKKQGEPEVPAPAASVRGSWSLLLSAE